MQNKVQKNPNSHLAFPSFISAMDSDSHVQVPRQKASIAYSPYLEP